MPSGHGQKQCPSPILSDGGLFADLNIPQQLQQVKLCIDCNSQIQLQMHDGLGHELGSGAVEGPICVRCAGVRARLSDGRVRDNVEVVHVPPPTTTAATTTTTTRERHDSTASLASTSSTDSSSSSVSHSFSPSSLLGSASSSSSFPPTPPPCPRISFSTPSPQFLRKPTLPPLSVIPESPPQTSPTISAGGKITRHRSGSHSSVHAQRKTQYTPLTPVSPSIFHSPYPSSYPSTHHKAKYPDPDPYQDITRLRLRAPVRRRGWGWGSLYPGSKFKGVQKSGQNQYDVVVTICDVDPPSSFLCGYLQISGLTDDYPTLTTYFDAEIIGSQYGFVTSANRYTSSLRPAKEKGRNGGGKAWSASPQDDMHHWRQFPAFNSSAVQKRLVGQNLHLREEDSDDGDDHGEGGTVFMRWKERFLVPDWRVRNISGASFEGFYYICISPPTPSPSSSCTSSPVRGRNQKTSLANEEPSTMTGYYFHKNSEPYQKLSLVHLEEGDQNSDDCGGDSGFEWR